ncbi:hypothetical protein [Francisella frigiditurris]|uniref:Uncharacterized protein n=1 Tax=Francisella frigiditurris TaxID=1542390 RepID=A0A1J0KSC6_9GAMM|nr:hypothetical protein [Francisella frigiditurris]APC96607.1 hypothetical protein KX01_1132 [Francisella frigiditurris]
MFAKFNPIKLTLAIVILFSFNPLYATENIVPSISPKQIAQLQKERKEFIQTLIDNRYVYKISTENNQVIVYVTPKLLEGSPASPQVREETLNTILAYYYTSNEKINKINIKSSVSDKEVGTYSFQDGLVLNQKIAR